jgi:3-methyladenine DNA glycosylase AlkD
MRTSARRPAEASWNTLESLRKDLRAAANPEKARILQRFFKTGKGQYGEGDVFLGVMVPKQRAVAKRHSGLSLAEAEELLRSGIHEERLTALFILVHQFGKGDAATRGRIYRFYMKNTRRINNWDLVDASAPYIVGPYLEGRDKAVLRKLARSPNLWERRIAILSTVHFIRCGDPGEALRVAEMLLGDPHDLIHKAVGWMLREVGKRCGEDVETAFLERHCRTMPRTMLRYAIERLPAERKAWFLNAGAQARAKMFPTL